MNYESDLFRFWAKTSQDKEKENAYHPLLCHMIDVAAVARLMWREVLSPAARRRVGAAFGLDEDSEHLTALIAFIAGLHDLGKASPPFTLRDDSKYTRNLHHLYTKLSRDPRGIPKPNEAPHGYVTAFALTEILQKEFSVPKNRAKRLAELVGGHHGTFRRLDKFSDKDLKFRSGETDWKEARENLAKELAKLLNVLPPLAITEATSPDNGTVMLLAGLVSIADWIGSDKRFFPCLVDDAKKADVLLPNIDGKNYSEWSDSRAQGALSKLGWLGWPKKTWEESFENLFPFPPRPLQQAVIGLTQTLPLESPGLFIIEEQMGAGKTETAIYLADCWNARLKQTGIYFALPTQATSNQMYDRVRSYLEKRYAGKAVPLQLLHSNALLAPALENSLKEGEKLLDSDGIHGDEKQSECPAKVYAKEWFTNRKKGLLTPFGVGTIDQALMAALQVKHVFVRHFGLAHKTVIIDEVHAYDAYMSALLERLLEWLAALRSPVILLSATLPTEKRRALTQAYAKGLGYWRDDDMPELPAARYPRITWTFGETAHAQTIQHKEEAEAESSQSLRPLCIEWVDGSLPDEYSPSFSLGERLQKELKEGGCAAVICNTVDRAQQVYVALEKCFEQGERAGLPQPQLSLFHARFLYEDREQIENETRWHFGKKETEVDFGNGVRRKAARPYRSVIVATQVIEQSLDIDFDVMVSDFAPVDLLLQRSGRIWRHEGNPRYDFKTPTLWLCRPDIESGIPQFDKGTEAVYSKYVLLRSWVALNDAKYYAEDKTHLTLDLTQALEELIEATYRTQGCPDNFDQVLLSLWQGANADALRSHWQKTWEKYKASINSQTSQAEDKRLNDPFYEGHLGGFFLNPREEDSPEIHAAHQALTRLGDSLQVVCLYGTEARPSLDAAGLDFINLKAEPDKEQARRLQRRSLTISRISVVKALRSQTKIPSGWEKSPLLRHYRYVLLNKETAGYMFRLDENLGLLIEERGK